ncbi:hypothetical protein [Plasmodium yoelii yoelii]|uniref:Uncharacterized protein n=1 Tax=Plasmodium yoelii yoelii TaxID=73239 RepID=Q7RGI3_PLAYO|nr:hypothetical protein [Plasmodium yoelii yoelii]
MLKNTALELSTYISNNKEIQKNIYLLITKSMHHPEAIKISTDWLHNMFVMLYTMKYFQIMK